MSQLPNQGFKPWSSLMVSEVKGNYEHACTTALRLRKEKEILLQRLEEIEDVECDNCDHYKREYEEACAEADNTEERRKIIVQAWNTEVARNTKLTKLLQL